MTSPTTRPTNTQSPKVYTSREIAQVMVALLAALFTAMISTTIVTTALPTIMADLNGTQRQYTWVITASLLTMTVSTPIWGKLSDLFNKKTLTQVAIFMFIVGSITAGFAPNVEVMMLARAVQGIAMGGLLALVQSVMGSIIAPRERGKYAGYMGAVMSVATVSGPLLGGVITDGLGWRWCFFVSVPLAIVAMILLQLQLRLETIERGPVKIDYLGSILVAITSALPMFWVTFAGVDFDWISWQSAAFLGGFLVAVTLTIFVELRVSEPIIPLRALRNKTAIWMIIASIGVGVAMFGSGVFLTQFFQLGLGLSATQAGIMTIPLILGQLVSSTFGGILVSRMARWKPVMLIGSIILLIGITGLGTIDHTTPYFLIAIYMVLMGLGVGSLVQNVVLAVQNTVDVSQVGAVSGAIAFFRSLAGAIGVAILGSVLSALVGANIAQGLKDIGMKPELGGDTKIDISGMPAAVQEVFHNAYADSFGPVFLISAATALLTVIAILIVRGTPLRSTIELTPVHSSEEPGAKFH